MTEHNRDICPHHHPSCPYNSVDPEIMKEDHDILVELKSAITGEQGLVKKFNDIEPRMRHVENTQGKIIAVGSVLIVVIPIVVELLMR